MVDDGTLLDLLADAAAAVRSSLDRLDDWRLPGTRPGQYGLDLVADAAALDVLHRAGLQVLSEESGTTTPDGGISADRQGLVVILDPVDGSTNASLGLPWYATSMCVLDRDGPRAALVVNQATGRRYEAVRGAGARRDGSPISPSGCRDLASAVIGVSGFPGHVPGWWQFRALGAAALDHCAVAEGALDGFATGERSPLHVWDYLGGMLVCREAGAVVGELRHQPLVVRDGRPRLPVAAATPDLFESLVAGLG